MEIRGGFMIIPVRCMTCGKVIGHQWEAFKEKTAKGENPHKVLDELGIERYCCRAVFIGHKDIIQNINKFI